jgi:hypothetical protein
MKFSEYILLMENQARNIDSVEAKQLIQDHCQIIIKNNYYIYRGIPNNSKYLFGNAVFDPPRKSANTFNFTTLIIDNSPLWAKYPKRSKSYICSTDKLCAETYGTLYRVYPFDGANIGICPTRDIWWSFRSTLTGTNCQSLDVLNTVLRRIFLEVLNRDHVDESFVDLKTACADIDAVLAKCNYDFDIFDNKYNMLPETCFTLLNQLTRNRDSLLQELIKILDPIKNNFSHIKLTKTKSTPLPFNKEVWTDSPCIFELITK